MPMTKESDTQDAPNSLVTDFCFVPHADGSYDALNNTFTGTLDSKTDQADVIMIELSAEREYTITLAGDANGLADPVLELLDAKGNTVAMNDDVDGPAGNLDSEITFAPAMSGTYYLRASAYAGNPGLTNKGGYTMTVIEMDLGAPTAITGTHASEKLFGTDGPDIITGKGGNDVLDGMGGNDVLDGGDGNDLITGGPGADEITGGSGTDTASYVDSAGGVSVNLMSGVARGGDAEGDLVGTDDDIENVIGAMNAGNTLTGNRMDNILWGGMAMDELSGGRGMDELYGGGGDDTLEGGEGDDELEGGPGADMLSGGAGADTASYAGSMAGVTVRLHNMVALMGDAEGDTFAPGEGREYTDKDGNDMIEDVADIEHLTGSPHDDILAGDGRDNILMGLGGHDTLYGGPLGGNDELRGGDGNDNLYGGKGDDALYGNDGKDMLSGGAGMDTYRAGDGDDIIFADKDDAEAAINGGGGNDTVSYERVKEALGRTIDLTNYNQVENVIGTQGDDTIVGDDNDNVIEGGEGADSLDGAGHTSTNDGGMGDTLSYVSSDDWVRVSLADSSASRGHASGDTFSNFENLTGSMYDDDLTGDKEDNIIKGLAGDDDIDAGAGNDTVTGGPGADKLDGGGDDADNDGMDTVSYAGSGSRVVVNLATASVSGGDAEGDEIVTYEMEINTGTDDEMDVDVSTFENATGSDHNDSLTGDDRDNVLMGGAGDDTLRGRKGMDTLHGGPGADVLDGGEDEGEDDMNMIPQPNDAGGNPVDPLPASVDTVSYAHSKDGVTVDLSTGTGTAGDAAGDTLVNIEMVVGSANDDTFILSSTDQNGMIDGGDNLVLRGNIFLGYVPEVDTPGDTVSYAASEKGVTIDLGNTTLTGIESITGSMHDDVLTADERSNTLKGGAGDDVLIGISNPSGTVSTSDWLDGGEGNDSLTGGTGGDLFFGGPGDDDFYDPDPSSAKNVYIFSPADGDGDDVIHDFQPGSSNAFNVVDTLDFSAFRIDPTVFDDGDPDTGVASELEAAGLLRQRGENIKIDLSDYGGGTITLVDVTVADLDRSDDVIFVF